MADEELFRLVTEATGLPTEVISHELDRLLNVAGVDRERLTLEDLRRVLADYVQDTLLAAKMRINCLKEGEPRLD